MYKIIEETNNVNSKIFYNVLQQVPYYKFWTEWKNVFKERSDYYGTSRFNTVLECLCWIKADMNTNRYRTTNKEIYTFTTLEEVNAAIKVILIAENAEVERINNMSDEEYYNGTKPNTQDESTNRETKA